MKSSNKPKKRVLFETNEDITANVAVFLKHQQGNTLKRLKLCASYLKSLLCRFCSSRHINDPCKHLKRFFIGRYSRRMIAVIILLAAIILLVFILNEDALKVVAPVFALFISGIIGYGAFIDEKRFEKLYDSKLDLYRKVLSEILYVQKLPASFLTSDANKLPIEELKSAAKDVNSSLDMLLVSNVASYSALSSLDKKVREKLYSLILLFTEINKIGAPDNRKLTDSVFYESLDKSKFSLESLKDKDIDSVDSVVSVLSSKLQMSVQVMLAMKEFNDLLVDLVNEMRNDLEIGCFTELEIAKIKNEFISSVNETFDFMGKLFKQQLKNGGIDLEV